VVKLSKGEPGKGGKSLTGDAKARALQEELVARNKELAEANDRIAQLEKTIKDTQKLAELKSPGMAAAQRLGGFRRIGPYGRADMCDAYCSDCLDR
jgi:pilus assembly protein FimV